MHGWGEGGDEEDSHVFGGYHTAKIYRIFDKTKLFATELQVNVYRLAITENTRSVDEDENEDEDCAAELQVNV